MTPVRIRVGGEQPYDVVVGTGLDDELAPLLTGAARVAVVHPAAMSARAAEVVTSLPDALPGVTVVPLEVPDGEAAKDLTVAARCWQALGDAGFTRSDAVVGLGGGAVTDLAGFVAATWLRGVRVVHLPTTLLGMVDAAVGGKTGINTTAGKNLVGSFHPPAGVLCDLSVLASLPAADYRAGLAEAVKCGFIADPALLDLVERDPVAASTWDGGLVEEVVERSVRVKAAVVAGDLRESGVREVLNYGHTLAHAIERVEDYRWRHGDAVSVGLVYAAELGRLAGRLDDTTAARHRAVLASLGLPVSYAGDFEALHAVMRVDKKARGSRLRFVVLDGLARPGILDDPPTEMLREAFAAVGEDPT